MIQFSEIKIKNGVEDHEKVCKNSSTSAGQKLKEGALMCCRNGWSEFSVQAPCSLFRDS